MSKIVKYQKFIRNFWLISFCLIVTLAKAGDWSQWFHTTPGNNIISNESMNNRTEMFLHVLKIIIQYITLKNGISIKETLLDHLKKASRRSTLY